MITIKDIKIFAKKLRWLPSHALTCRAVSNQTDTYEYNNTHFPQTTLTCCHLIFILILDDTIKVQSTLTFQGISSFCEKVSAQL